MLAVCLLAWIIGGVAVWVVLFAVALSLAVMAARGDR